MIRILLADDHDEVRRGLRELLQEARPEWQVCGEAADGRTAVELARRLQPDVAVLDLTMPGLDGLEATRQIRRAQPRTEVLIFTMHETEQLVREVLAAGARGYMLKSDAARQVVAAVEALAEHRPYFTAAVSEALLRAFVESGGAPHSARTGPLSPREREVPRLLSAGQSNKEVARELSISVNTLESHRAAVMRKLELGSVVELVHYAVRERLVTP